MFSEQYGTIKEYFGTIYTIWKQFRNKRGAVQKLQQIGAWGSSRKADQTPTKSLKYPQKQKDLMEITAMNLVDPIMIVLNITSIILLVLVVKEYRKLIGVIENDE